MDRALRGLIAGFIGSITMNTWSIFSHYALNFADRKFFDWSGILVFGRLPDSISEIVVGLLFQVVWTSFFGVLFAYLIPTITSQHIILKGAVFGLLLSFVFFIIPMLFSINLLMGVTLGNAVTEMVGGTIWGATTALSLIYLNKQYV